MNRSERERTVLLVQFFAERTAECIGRKLFKLLYLTDVLHCQATGVPVTGLEYAARRSTPLPYELKHELEDPRGDLTARVRIEEFREGTAIRHRFLTLGGQAFDPSAFSPRQVTIINGLAQQFKATLDSDLDGDSIDRGVWRRTALDRPIDLSLAILRSDPHYAALRAFAEEYKERKAYA
jgi:hypothetical protein